MKQSVAETVLESLEPRRLFAWSDYAQLANQDGAAEAFSEVTGRGVTVAVIDTGINYNLPSLGGGFGAGRKVIGGYDYFDNDANPMDAEGHGTAVASVVAARPYTVNGVTYQGVAPEAKLVALRVGDADGFADSNIEKALKWVVANRQLYNISVVNLSLGSGNYADRESNSRYTDEFRALREGGVFVVAASGNSNDEDLDPIDADGVSYPAADPSVFAVGAVDADDVISDWTQRGDELDLLAPGVGIVVPELDGTFVSVNGTSFASPYVAGTAALIKHLDATALPGDIGSILMSSGAPNRDGDDESFDTTGLLFSRLDIAAALSLTQQRIGKYASLDMGSRFSTALDSQGVLHAGWYDDVNGRLLYAARDASGLWSNAYVVDGKGDVGAALSVAVDPMGKVGIAYFDVTNTGIKYASLDGAAWARRTIESEKHVGLSPSLGFDTDGNGYLAYYRRSGGDLRLARQDRDSGAWTRETVDGLRADVGAVASLDVGEAAIRSDGFTVYDTTVAIAYSDSSNGDLRYARLDVDDPAATWFISIVEDASGVANIDLDLHDGTTVAGLQAQIAYQDTATADVKYAYRNTDWFVETVAAAGKLGDYVRMSFDGSNRPHVIYFHRTLRILYRAARTEANRWPVEQLATSAGPVSVATNERTGAAFASWLNRSRAGVFTVSVA